MATIVNQPESYEHLSTKYEVECAKTYEDLLKDNRLQVYLYSAGCDFLKREAANKRVVDIGCGPGQWCQLAAQYGAKRVDGIDINANMTEVAKQRNSDVEAVHISVGDATSMPYADNAFDVAMCFLMILNLPSVELYCNFFKELYRVLAPGGKAAVVTSSDEGWRRLYLYQGADQLAVEERIDKVLATLPAHPTLQQFNEAIEPYTEIEWACFMPDESGHLFRIKDIEKLPNAQKTWARIYGQITFIDYHFKESYTMECIKAAGLVLDRSENYFTEGRRIAHNSANTRTKHTDTKVKYPPALMYHISKPL